MSFMYLFISVTITKMIRIHNSKIFKRGNKNMNKENLKTDEISEFLEKIYPEHFNCVYSCNGMTLLRSEEYDYILKYIIKLQRENKKQKEVINKTINLNEKIKHFVYENLLEENIIGSKIIYEFVEKQNKILKEVSE